MLGYVVQAVGLGLLGAGGGGLFLRLLVPTLLLSGADCCVVPCVFVMHPSCSRRW